MKTSWTALYIAGLILTEALVMACYLFSLARPDAPGYWFFQLLGLYVAIPAILGLGLGFRKARKDSLRDVMSHTLPAGLLAGIPGFLLYSLFPGFPRNLDLAFTIWALVFLGSFCLFLLSRQLYRSFQSRQQERK